MTRLSENIKNNIQLNNILSWVDLGTGNGVIVNEMEWNKTAIEKISIEKYPQFHDNSWIFVDNLDDILNKKRDLFTGFDVIEHFTKENGVKLLEKIDDWFENIIFFTPRGFLKQDETTHPELIKINPWQTHLSGWEVDDFKNFGYDVIILKNFHYPPSLNKYFDGLLAIKRK